MSFWRDNDNNDNNDNIRAGAKFDAGVGAETSFPLTVALYTYISVWKYIYNFSLLSNMNRQKVDLALT